MKTASIPPATSGKAHLRGVALASVIMALIAAFFLKDVPFVPTSGRRS
jgi:hypothetical protein